MCYWNVMSVGINTLIAHGVYTSAYTLHDVSNGKNIYIYSKCYKIFTNAATHLMSFVSCVMLFALTLTICLHLRLAKQHFIILYTYVYEWWQYLSEYICVNILSLLQGDIEGVDAEPNDRKVRKLNYNIWM